MNIKNKVILGTASLVIGLGACTNGNFEKHGGLCGSKKTQEEDKAPDYYDYNPNIMKSQITIYPDIKDTEENTPLQFGNFKKWGVISNFLPCLNRI